MAVSSLKWRVTEITNCPICLEEIVNAKSLPCLHSFCQKCLEDYCEDKLFGQSAKCPICRKEFTVPENGIHGLPHNFFLESLTDAKKWTGDEEGEILCDVCVKEDVHVDQLDSVPEASVYCIDCCQKLCKPCSRPHKRWTGGPHQLRDLGAHGMSELPLMQQHRSHCEKHKLKLIELYCFECKMNLCMKCFAVSHTQHKCGEIEQVADEFNKRIDVSIKQVRQQICEVNSVIAKTEAKATIIHAAAEKVENEVTQKCEKMKQLIDAKAQELQEEIRKLHTVAMKDIDAQRDSLQLALVAMESYTEYATVLRTKGSHADVTMFAEKLHDRASELLENHSKTENTDKCSALTVEFTPSHIVEEWVQTGENIIGSIRYLMAMPEPAYESNRCQELEKQTLQKLSDEGECFREHKKLNTEPADESNRRQELERQTLQKLSVEGERFKGCKVIHTIKASGVEVCGLSVCQSELHVLLCDTKEGQGQIKTYDIHNYKNKQARLSTPVSVMWDMASSVTDNCLYMSNLHTNKLQKVTRTGSLTDFRVAGSQIRGLAMLPNGNLLVTCRNPDALTEVGGDGAIVNKILLPRSVMQPWHAVWLSTGNFAVCHGSGPNSEHRVCIVESSGHVTRSFGSYYGSESSELNVPCHLAVDENDFIFVADCINKRVTLLCPMLTFVCHVTDKMKSRPQRLYLDRDAQRLYVGQQWGHVLVVQL